MLSEIATVGPEGASFAERVSIYFGAQYPHFQTGVLTLFAGMNSVRILAYIPQILRAARDTNGASAISYGTWGLFFVSHLTTIVYALICLGDGLMALIFIGNAFACLMILGVTVLKRRAHIRNVAIDR